jgi:cytochrome c peroxidase
MHRRYWFLALAALALAACKGEPAPAAKAPSPAPAAQPAAVTIDPAHLALFGVLPAAIESADNPITEEKVALGRMLYYDTRLSKNQDLSCNSCHDLANYGHDGKPVSPGHKQQLGTRNSPTVYNAAGRFAQFWDGRAATIEEQALGPLTNPVEMAMPSLDHVVRTLKSIPGYVEAFRKAFPGEKDPVTADNVGKAIGAFERKLVTPSKWDKFLATKDQNLLTDDEKAGFHKFVMTGCTACHAGPYVGGMMFQKTGLVKPWPNLKDGGRFDVTKNEADKFMFVVPTLRNVEKTAPYFHDGSVASLEESVKMMAEYNLGRQLPDEDVKQIVAWMKTLTGELPPQDLIAKPELPPSGPKTPKPDPT